MQDTKEHEYAIIGSMIVSGESVIIDALNSLTKDYFTYHETKYIFEAIRDIYETEGIVPSDSDIFAYLSANNNAVPGSSIADILRFVTSNYDWHISELIDARQRDTIRRHLMAYTVKAEEENIDAQELAEMITTDINTSVSSNMSSYTHISSIAELICDPEHTATPIRSGYHELDSITGGYYAKEYVIIGARPSTGKTAIMVNMAYNMAKNGFPVGILSLEMPSEAIVNRMVCGLANVIMNNKLEGKLSKHELDRIRQSADHVSTLPIYIDDTSAPTINNVKSICRKLKTKHNVKVIFIDYLTKIVSHETRKTDNREREVSRISTMLKDTAKDLGITIVAMSQLSRLSEQRADRRPMASDLRDSGQIEQDADKIILLHKPGIGKITLYGRDGTRYIEFIVAKNRNGRVGACDLYYDYQNMTFKNLMPENNGWIIKTSTSIRV